jgi:hypothetical protein
VSLYRHYQDFMLAIYPGGDRYHARVLASPAGQSGVDFTLPFSPHELAHIDGRAWTSRTALAGIDPATIGTVLFTHVFKDGIRDCFYSSLERIGKDEGLRIVLRLTDVPEMATLPWELLFDSQHDRFLALSNRTPVIRYLELPIPEPETLRVDPPLSILAVLSNPSDFRPSLDVAREWAKLQSVLAPLQERGIIQLERLPAATLDALRQRLQSGDVHVLHYVGHGDFDPDRAEGGLLFENAEGLSHLVIAEHLKVVLHNHPSLRLIFLNACDGAVTSLYNPFTGVAQSLVRQGVPAVIAMQGQIGDSVATKLATAFYTALANNYTTDAALTEARVALFTEHSLEWATPVLYSRSRDNRLYNVRLPPPPCPYPGMAPFSAAQQNLFFGREQEIRDGLARLRIHPFLALIGPSGSGKSSLVNAGIVPALVNPRQQGASGWSLKSMRPGSAPLARLAETFARPIKELPLLCLDEPTLLVIDQLEELFTQASASDAREFALLLAELSGKPQVKIIVTVRADFYSELMASPLWKLVQSNRLELAPLDPAGLRAAIVSPAEAVDVEIEHALVERLIADAAGDAGALPFLQETLIQLWEEMDEGKLGLARYERLGENGHSGLETAIARRADVTYGQLDPGQQKIAQRIFLRLVQFGEGRADLRRQLSFSQLTIRAEDESDLRSVLQKLVADRLLILSVNEHTGERLVDISHESLLNGWPQLKTWRESRREAEQARRRFETSAQAYLYHERRGGLLDEVELLEVERWLASPDAAELGGPSDTLAELVTASRQAIEQARQREEEANQRELILERRARHRTQALAAFLSILLLFFIAQGIHVGYLRWQTQRAVELKPVSEGHSVRMEITETTNERYQKCVDADACTAPSRHNSTYFKPGHGLFPVTGITMLQAYQFCEWIGRRLPTRDEWLAAATNNNTTKYPWNDDPPSYVQANLDFAGHPVAPKEVGQYSEGANNTKILDLVGNVYEWTTTCSVDNSEKCEYGQEWNGRAETLPTRLYMMGGAFSSLPSAVVKLETNASAEGSFSFLGFRCVTGDIVQK